MAFNDKSGVNCDISQLQLNQIMLQWISIQPVEKIVRRLCLMPGEAMSESNEVMLTIV
jgi:hypothetical protein